MWRLALAPSHMPKRSRLKRLQIELGGYMYEQSPEEIEAHLREQLGTLQRSAHLYDEGYTAEAKRIAVNLRVILHTKRYPSLLKQLDREDIDFLDTADAPDPANLLSTMGLVGLHMDSSGGSYLPVYDTNPQSKWVPFTDWWSGTVFLDVNKTSLTRANLILSVADQDGGAHVDAKLNEAYAAISRQNSLGWNVGHDGQTQPMRNPELAAVRQIAHEVLITLVPGYRRTMDQALAARREPEISGGKMRFYPSSKTLFSSELVAPLVVGSRYLAKIAIDSISVGSVRMIVGSGATEPFTTPGEHSSIVTAVSKEPSGVWGEFTDAIIDNVGIHPLTGGSEQ